MGALSGLRIIEMAGLGPAPFAAMMLADHGADVIRVERPSQDAWPIDILNRSRKTIQLDMKSAEGRTVLRRLIKSADGLIEGFRPGVMERLDLGPDTLIAENPALVYGRMTGWGQTGPYAPAAGHDINYIALAGALAHMGRAGGVPTPPINLVGDFGGGGMLMAFGMVSALLSAHRTGVGQVIDCAMVDGSALLMAMTWSLRATGSWSDQRGTNIIDTGAHFYEVYECADGRYISVGAIEPQFYARLISVLELDPALCATQMDSTRWPEMKELFAARFKTKTLEQWCALLEGADACFAPVLTMDEAAVHPHNVARSTFIEADGVLQPAPAPRFSETPALPPQASSGNQGDTTRELLASVGYEASDIAALEADGILG